MGTGYDGKIAASSTSCTGPPDTFCLADNAGAALKGALSIRNHPLTPIDFFHKGRRETNGLITIAFYNAE